MTVTTEEAEIAVQPEQAATSQTKQYEMTSEGRLRDAYLRQICHIYYDKSRVVDGVRKLKSIEDIVDLNKYLSIIQSFPVASDSQQEINITALKSRSQDGIDTNFAKKIMEITETTLAYKSVEELIKNSLYNSLKDFLDANIDRIKAHKIFGISKTTLESFLAIYFKVLGFNLDYISEGDSKTDFLAKLRACLLILSASSNSDNETARKYLINLQTMLAIEPTQSPDKAIIPYQPRPVEILRMKLDIKKFITDNGSLLTAEISAGIEAFDLKLVIVIAELIKISSLNALLENPFYKANFGKQVQNQTIAFILAIKLIELGLPGSDLTVAKKAE